jgi:hypothetical protein
VQEGDGVEVVELVVADAFLGIGELLEEGGQELRILGDALFEDSGCGQRGRGRSRERAEERLQVVLLHQVRLLF